MREFSGFQVRPGKLGQRQRAAAEAFGLDLIWGSEPLPGRTLSAAGDHGVPAIYVELRGEGRCRPEDRRTAVQGIRNLLIFLNMTDGQLPETASLYVETLGDQAGHLQLDHPSPTSGSLCPMSRHGMPSRRASAWAWFATPTAPCSPRCHRRAPAECCSCAPSRACSRATAWPIF